MKIKLKSVSTKILLLVLISTFISFTILGFYNTLSSYNSHNNLIKSKEINLAKETAKFINAYLESKLDVIVAVSNELKDENLDIKNQSIFNKLNFAANAGKIESIYYGFEHNGDYMMHDGNIRTTSTTDYDPRKRPWYKQALKENKAGITDPYVDYSTKKLVITLFKPVYKNGKLMGVVGADMFIDTIVNTILQVNIDGQGSAHVTNAKNTIIIHKDEKMIKKQDSVLSQIKTTKSVGFGKANYEKSELLASYGNIKIAKWDVVIKLNSAVVYKEINNSIINEIILYAFLLIIIIAIMFFTLIKLLSPLKALDKGFDYFFRFLKGKESDIKEIKIKSSCEFGKMAKAINEEMRSVANTINQDRALIEEVKEVVEIVSHRKFHKRIQSSTSTDSLNELKDLLNHMLDKLEKQVGKDMNLIIKALESYTNRDFTARLDESSGNIGSEIIKMNRMITKMLQGNQKDGQALRDSSDRLTQSVQVLNGNATNQASSLEETAASIEEITGNIEQTSKKAQEMNEISNETKNSATEGKKLATDTVNSMDEINSTVMDINEAITVIDQIAFQTNILSLNAAVEAATAGEAGKGFAVVAQEVRNLAARSAEAAKDIKELVESATAKANKGKEISSVMIQGFNSLEDKVVDTSKLIEDVTTAAKEQTLGMRQIADAVALLDKFTQENASIAEQANMIARETQSIANDVVENVNKNNFDGKSD